MNTTDNLKYLKTLVGEEASFHIDQEDAINSCLEKGTRTLLVQKTGWGKSAVYFIAAKSIKETHGKMTVIVSPLISLMRNQILNAKELIDVQSINSGDDFGKIKETQEALLDGEVDVLIVSPRDSQMSTSNRIYFQLLQKQSAFLSLMRLTAYQLGA